MALLAEQIVEEWLNRQGYFTIRGIKVGVHEMDLLAIRSTDQQLECRHFEVQASVRPVTYLAAVTKEIRKRTGRAAGSAKQRTLEEMQASVQEWIAKKFHYPDKTRLRNRLAPGPWSLELVVHKLRHADEADIIQQHGIRVHTLSTIVQDLERQDMVIGSAGNADLVDLILRDREALASEAS